MVQNVFSNRHAKLGHAFSKPGRHTSAMKRQVRKSRALHQDSILPQEDTSTGLDGTRSRSTCSEGIDRRSRASLSQSQSINDAVWALISRLPCAVPLPQEG